MQPNPEGRNATCVSCKKVTTTAGSTAVSVAGDRRCHVQGRDWRSRGGGYRVAGWEVQPFPVDFHTQEIETNGATIHVRFGGKGPAVVLLHGYGETGDMWAPMAEDLARDHTIVVPDLRGLGLSSKPAGGFDKKTQAGDVAGVLDALKIDRAALVTHDIGNMVGYAFAVQHPQRVTRFVLIDAPLPGLGPWDEILKNPLLWHFRFGGPDMERLVAGRERIYLDRFWNEFSADAEPLYRGLA